MNDKFHLERKTRNEANQILKNIVRKILKYTNNLDEYLEKYFSYIHERLKRKKINIY